MLIGGSMTTYRAIVHYHFKKGMEQQGIRFFENELLKKAQEYGCHSIELWQDERDPQHLIGTGMWNSLEEARRFQSHWNEKERELINFCTNTPKREFLKIKATYSEKSRRVA